MAFTTSQKIKILKYLGYPANTINPNSLSYSKIISDRLLNVLEDAEPEVLDYLDRISALDERLESGINRAGVKRIDDIELDSTHEMGTLRLERKRLIRELAQLIDIYPIQPGSMGSICV